MNLSRKIALVILGVFVPSGVIMAIVQHVLYSKNFVTVLGSLEQSINELKRNDALDILQEVKIATEGSLQRGEHAQFMNFAQQQQRLKEIREFSFYGGEGKVELSSDPKAVGRAIDPALWSKAQGTKDVFVVENDKALLFYGPLHSDADMCRLNPKLKPNELYGVLHLAFSKDVINGMVANAQGVYKSNSSKAVMTTTAALLLSILVVVGASIVVSRRITRPIRAALEVLQHVAGGDLTKRLNFAGHDEIAELSKALDTTTQTLQQTVQGIRDHASTLVNSSSELSSTAVSMAEGAEQATRQSTSVNTAATELSTNMGGMAAAAEEMNANVRTVSAAVEEMTASIGEVARNAQQAAEIAGNAMQLAQASNSDIGQLNSAADQIGQVLEVIRDIAEQTNLLALNATIEAARAGDMGKGFGVVAAEVKNLARQTSEATEDIRRRIEGIQQSTGKAVQSIGEITQVIGNVDSVSRTIAAAVEEQSITTRQIAQTVAQTADSVDKVAKNVNQSAAASQEISKGIASVDQAARDSAQGAARTQSAGREMSDLAGQLQSLVGKFKV